MRENTSTVLGSSNTFLDRLNQLKAHVKSLEEDLNNTEKQETLKNFLVELKSNVETADSEQNNQLKKTLNELATQYKEKGNGLLIALQITNGKFQTNLSDAISNFNLALLLNPDDIEVLRDRSGAYYIQGQYKAAIADYEAIISKTETAQRNPADYQSVGDLYFAAKNISKAIENYEEAKALYKDKEHELGCSFFENLGKFYYLNNGLPKAIEAYQEAEKIHKNNPSNEGKPYEPSIEYKNAIKLIEEITPPVKESTNAASTFAAPSNKWRKMLLAVSILATTITAILVAAGIVPTLLLLTLFVPVVLLIESKVQGIPFRKTVEPTPMVLSTPSKGSCDRVDSQAVLQELQRMSQQHSRQSVTSLNESTSKNTNPNINSKSSSIDANQSLFFTSTAAQSISQSLNNPNQQAAVNPKIRK